MSMMFYPFNINLPLNCYLILLMALLFALLMKEVINRAIILLNIAK